MAGVEDTPDFLEMSDEEFAKLSEPDFSGSEETTTEEVEETPEEVTEEEEPNTPAEEEESTEEAPAAEEEVVEEEAPAEEPGEEEEGGPEGEDPKTGEEDPAAEIDYKAAYEALMAPFKANGTTITPESLEEVQQLAQMGANYHKKMAGMAPARKALKTLEVNGLLDEGKLDLLIDASKGNPEAITKLMKDSNIDPLSVDVEAESTYVPTDHSASDAELLLDEVLTDIQDTPSYSKTIDAVTNRWDPASRNAVAAEPHILRVINEHMDSGVYDQVMSTVERERSFGRLTGVSDFEAYKHVGEQLEKAGTLKMPANPTIGNQTPVTPTTPKVDPAAEQLRRKNKKAAGPTKTTPKKVGGLPKDFNPLDMSDEEFEKFDPKLIGL